MTRKDFIKLAGALKNIQPDIPGVMEFNTKSVKVWNNWIAAVDSVADVCEQSNPQFNRKKFVKACGYEAL